jgi:hypothetical protein
MNHQQQVAAFTAAMATFADVMSSVVDAVAGHRRRLENVGFSETAAEQMSVQYHQFLLSTLIKAAEKASS